MNHCARIDAQREQYEACRSAVRQTIRHLKFRIPPERFEDAFQVGMLAAVRCAPSYQQARGASFYSFAWLAIRGAIIDAIPRRLDTNREEVYADQPAPWAAFDSIDARDHLEWLLSALPPRQRKAVRLYDIEGQPIEQVAEACGYSSQYTLSILSIAHGRMREMARAARRGAA